MRFVKNRTEKATFHFNLGLSPLSNANHEYTLATGEGTFVLKRHTPQTLALHKGGNLVLGLMSAQELQKITHYAEDVVLPSDVARLLRLTYSSGAKGAEKLPALAGVKIHIPEKAARANRLTRGGAVAKGAHPLLRRLAMGGAVPSNVDQAQLYADADMVFDTPLDTARAIVFQHPQLATRNPDSAAIIVQDHIDTTADLMNLALLVSKLGPATEHGGWATISPSVDKDGNVLTWGPGFPDHPEGTPVYQYRLSDEIAGTLDKGPTDVSCPSVTKEALRTSQDDNRLQNDKWTVQQGTSDRKEERDTCLSRMNRLCSAEGTGGYQFTLNFLTPGYGVEAYQSSIDFKPDTSTPGKGEFSIDTKNYYLRTLAAYVQFFDMNGNSVAAAKDAAVGLLALPPDVLREMGVSSDKQYVDILWAVNVILGIPMPSDPINLDFTWPATAESCHLLLGGLGTSNWDGDVDTVGAILTGVFQYGIPVLFLAAGAMIENTGWYKAFMQDKDMRMAVLGVAFPIVGGGVATASAVFNTKRVLFSFGDAMAGILASQLLGRLAAYVFAKITAAEAADSIPFVGWACRIASMVVTGIEITETTVEVLISPATYNIEIKRKLALEATIKPDPLHGTETDPAVWPQVATNYVVIVQYKNGTNFTSTGKLPTDQSKRADPIVATFPDLPSGGRLQISCGVYSDDQWLAGQWTSSWMDAVLPAGARGPLKVAGAIQESLVPLTAQTQYLYDSKLCYDAGCKKHIWVKGAQPTAVVTDLNSSPTGNNLAELVDVTINNRAYMLGYCWQASGQDLPFHGSTEPTEGQIYSFQNICTLSDPDSALKFPCCGFSSQTYLSYDQFGPAPLFSLAGSFEADLDAGKVTDALKEAFSSRMYPLPDGTTVRVATPTARWYLITTGGGDPAYDLRRDPDGSINVFQYPTPLFSPNNFYIDTSTDKYHLRRVTLDDQTPFDMTPSLSYGYFTQPHLDSVKVHPAGYVVGVNWKNCKMEIIRIPEQGVPDDLAQPAIVASGAGIRQGLMLGPKAIAVSADGRILVLETLNKRIQAFDINGNPVPCFNGNDIVALDASSFAADLDEGFVTVALRGEFAAHGAELSRQWCIADGSDKYGLKGDTAETVTVKKNGASVSDLWAITDSGGSYGVKVDGDHLTVKVEGAAGFTLPLADRMYLDCGSVESTIIAAFKENGITLSQQATVTGNGLCVSSSCEEELNRGTIPDAVKQALATRDITLSPAATLSSDVNVTVIELGAEWKIMDSVTAQAYRVFKDPSDTARLKSLYLNPVTDLHEPDPSATVQYLDLAVEMKGYIYLLSYTGDGSNVGDYRLDIYKPTGEWLTRTPDASKDPKATGINGGKLVVDMWRSMFTLNFEHFQGPGGRTEPSVSMWLPTMPG
ncbi:MAG TPA: hypothetical protein VI298_10450 [Geobacteraceae bacterium]